MRHPVSPARLSRAGLRLYFDEDFSSPELDETRWLPFYLPQWSSRERTRARYELRDGMLDLLIEADQLPWAPEYDGDLRVSNLQTGVFSGPVGSGIGQHRFRPDVTVHEFQPEQRLYLQHHGLIEARARATADPHCMVALYLLGFEDVPEHSAELCVFEIFGREVEPAHALVGMGVHPHHDPSVTDDFAKVPVDLDVTEFHDYAALWTADGVRFYVDEQLVAEVDESPGYPLQLMLDIYEFPATEAAPPTPYPKRFTVDWVRGWSF